MVKEWDMDQGDFERFLAWLHPDRDEGCMKYQDICRRLMTVCRARGFTEMEAEEIVDETINRVVRKVPEIADFYTGDPALYCYGVLRNVMHEWHRHPTLVPPPPPPPDDLDQKERLAACLDHCMEKLSAEDRQLVLDYYADKGRAKIERRRELAERLGISENALRIRLTRLRATLKTCILACLEQTP